MAAKEGKAGKETPGPVTWKRQLFDPAKQYGNLTWTTSPLGDKRHPPTAEMVLDLVKANADDSVPPKFRKAVEVCGQWEKIDGTQLYLAAWLFPGIPRAGTRTPAEMVRDLARTMAICNPITRPRQVKLRMVGKK